MCKNTWFIETFPRACPEDHIKYIHVSIALLTWRKMYFFCIFWQIRQEGTFDVLKKGKQENLSFLLYFRTNLSTPSPLLSGSSCWLEDCLSPNLSPLVRNQTHNQHFSSHYRALYIWWLFVSVCDLHQPFFRDQRTWSVKRPRDLNTMRTSVLEDHFQIDLKYKSCTFNNPVSLFDAKFAVSIGHKK